MRVFKCAPQRYIKRITKNRTNRYFVRSIECANFLNTFSSLLSDITFYPDVFYRRLKTRRLHAAFVNIILTPYKVQKMRLPLNVYTIHYGFSYSRVALILHYIQNVYEHVTLYSGWKRREETCARICGYANHLYETTARRI